MQTEKSVQKTCLEAIESDIINSAHDCSEGGLAVTLTESCISSPNKMLGAVIELDGLKNNDIRMDEILFGEAPSRIVVSLNKDKMDLLEKIVQKHSIAYAILGEVSGENLVVKDNRESIIDISIKELSDTWRNAIPRRLEK